MKFNYSLLDNNTIYLPPTKSGEQGVCKSFLLLEVKVESYNRLLQENPKGKLKVNLLPKDDIELQEWIYKTDLELYSEDKERKVLIFRVNLYYRGLGKVDIIGVDSDKAWVFDNIDEVVNCTIPVFGKEPNCKMCTLNGDCRIQSFVDDPNPLTTRKKRVKFEIYWSGSEKIISEEILLSQLQINIDVRSFPIPPEFKDPFSEDYIGTSIEELRSMSNAELEALFNKNRDKIDEYSKRYNDFLAGWYGIATPIILAFLRLMKIWKLLLLLRKTGMKDQVDKFINERKKAIESILNDKVEIYRLLEKLNKDFTEERENKSLGLDGLPKFQPDLTMRDSWLDQIETLQDNISTTWSDLVELESKVEVSPDKLSAYELPEVSVVKGDKENAKKLNKLTEYGIELISRGSVIVNPKGESPYTVTIYKPLKGSTYIDIDFPKGDPLVNKTTIESESIFWQTLQGGSGTDLYEWCKGFGPAGLFREKGFILSIEDIFRNYQKKLDTSDLKDKIDEEIEQYKVHLIVVLNGCVELAKNIVKLVLEPLGAIVVTPTGPGAVVSNILQVLGNIKRIQVSARALLPSITALLAAAKFLRLPEPFVKPLENIYTFISFIISFSL